ncbi:MAG TPA: HAMP domain-containing sensor histidine kinase [Anaeromyxobacteraceae bacterium]|nr:HAMP domain-containing sensor histidine kinase [Anaeromyxobacteraceae bacterium]
MKGLRTLRGRLAAAFAAAVLGTVVVFGTSMAAAIFVHDHEERLAFGGNPEAKGWVGDDLEEAKNLGVAMLVVSPIAVAFAALFGWWLAGRAVGPMHEAAERARRALRGGGELQLPVRGIGDEWDDLAGVMNELLSAQAEAAGQARAFSANAAHELRTPLTAMLGEVQVTLRRERSPEAYRTALAVVEEETKRLARLVEMLLALARADAGTLNPDAIPFDLARAARLSADRALGAHPGADRRIALRLSPATAVGDPLLTGRVLDNLLENALKYGGRNVEVAVDLAPGGARVVVSDDGPGVPPTIRDRVFERFARDGEPSSGFGLGLAIARALAEAQGGRLWLDAPERGARFVLEVPAPGAEAAPAP